MISAANLRKCSPIAAALAGTAVCLGVGQAHAVTGQIAASNGGNSTFSFNDSFNVFSSKAVVFLSEGSPYLHWVGVGGSISFGATGSNVLHTVGNIPVDGDMNFVNNAVDFGGRAGYIPARFQDGGTRYGWFL